MFRLDRGDDGLRTLDQIAGLLAVPGQRTGARLAGGFRVIRDLIWSELQRAAAEIGSERSGAMASTPESAWARSSSAT